MKLVDLNQTIFIPVVDEPHGGAVVEMKMTVGEFFEKCCPGFAPEVVEAIPVEWLQDMARRTEAQAEPHFAFMYVLHEWQESKPIEVLRAESEMWDWKMEQEAQDG